jgi:hypothetical protein
MDIKEFDHRIQGLKSDLKSYGDEIVAIVSAQMDTGLISPIPLKLDMKHDPRNAIYLLNDDLSAIINEKIELKHQLSSQMQLDVSECKQRLSLLETICAICDLFSSIDISMTSHDLKFTAAALAEVSSRLALLPAESSDVGSGHVCKLLRSEHLMVQERFFCQLRRLLDHIIVISPGKILVRKQIVGVIPNEEVILDDALSMEDIWHALLSIDRAHAYVNHVIDSLWSHIIQPLFHERKAPQVKAHVSPNNSDFEIDFANKSSLMKENIEVTINRLNTEVSAPSLKIPLPTFLDNLVHILSFIYVEVFGGIDELSQNIAAAFLLPTHLLIPTVIDVVINAQPKLESELVAFRKSVDKPLKELEKKLIAFNLYAPLTKEMLSTIKKTDSQYSVMTSAEPFSMLLDRLDGTFNAIRRRDILSKGREYILADYHNVMMASGDAAEDEVSSAGNIGDPQAMLEQSGSYAMQALAFDPCQISLAACRIMKLAHEVFKQLHDASVNTKSMLIQSVRDCLELFLFMIPVRYAETIHTSQRMGAVFYNDCLYIAHNTTLLTHIYRNSIDQQQQVLSFVDMIPRFRAAGEAILTKHMDEAMKQIRAHVEAANINPLSASAGKAVTIQSVVVDNNELAVESLIRLFSKLHEEWHDVLQQVVYDRVVHHLFDSMLNILMAPLFAGDCTCITETAASDISRLFRSIQAIREVAFTRSADNEEADAYASLTLGAWSKFTALTDLLEYSLADIADWLPRYVDHVAVLQTLIGNSSDHNVFIMTIGRSLPHSRVNSSRTLSKRSSKILPSDRACWQRSSMSRRRSYFFVELMITNYMLAPLA